MAPRKPRIAIAYDFDGTLAPGNMQEHQFIPDIGMSVQDFWQEVVRIAKENDGDEVLVYMSMMLEKANAKHIPVNRASLKEKGKGIKLFPGVSDWFDRINDHAKSKDVIAEHYLISSGNEEIAAGTSIASEFKRIYASKFRYNEYDAATWPVLAVNYTNKTQFLFRINKGVLDAADKKGVNKFVPMEERPVPFDNMVFIGDGETDVPCFRLVKDLGGLSIAVHEPRKSELAKRLLREGRVQLDAVADYSAGKPLETAIFAKIDEVAARHALDKTLK